LYRYLCYDYYLRRRTEDWEKATVTAWEKWSGLLDNTILVTVKRHQEHKIILVILIWCISLIEFSKYCFLTFIASSNKITKRMTVTRPSFVSSSVYRIPFYSFLEKINSYKSCSNNLKSSVLLLCVLILITKSKVQKFSSFKRLWSPTVLQYLLRWKI
jgi:hypothetical protein